MAKWVFGEIDECMVSISNRAIPSRWRAVVFCRQRQFKSICLLVSCATISFWGTFPLVRSPIVLDTNHVDSLESILGAKKGTSVFVGQDNTSARESKSVQTSWEEQPILKASELPDASDWKATAQTPHEVCFVTAVYSSSPETSDRPPDVQDIREANPTFSFFAFTNMDRLDAPGWTIKRKKFTYKRYITQSRWAKFMGWKDKDILGCQAVFFMDGFCGPKRKHSDRYKRLAKAIHNSTFGIFQNRHEAAKGPLDELNRIVEREKDIPKNVEASKTWLLSQPDFHPQIPVYANHYIGYDPKNEHIRRAAQFFWDRYSLELDSWRDQPLWSYVLYHFGILPTRLGTFDALFKEYYTRMGHAGHRYDAGADSNAIHNIEANA